MTGPVASFEDCPTGPGPCIIVSGRAGPGRALIIKFTGLIIKVAGWARAGPTSVLRARAGPGPGPGRARASNLICGPGQRAKARPVQGPRVYGSMHS